MSARLRRATRPHQWLWLVPISLSVAAWALLPSLFAVPEYKLPRLLPTVTRGLELIRDGDLGTAVANSLLRLGEGFVLGAGLGLILGLLIATRPVLAAYLDPVIALFQAVAGISWIPLAIVWFGFGAGPVLFVVANAIFFIVLSNTVLGVRTIPPVLHDGLRTLGATRPQLMREVVVPGALVQVLTGVRSGLAFGWRALIAVELIANSPGLGQMTQQAAASRDAETILLVVVVIGVLWLAMDTLVLQPLEQRTVVRWGIVESKEQ